MALDSPSPLLKVPTDRQERWKLVREVIRQWFPADPGKLGLPLGMSPVTAPPTACPAIQEWYTIVREAPGIWCQQDHLFGESINWQHHDYLEIAAENQVCAYWAVRRSDLEQDDPPVFLNRGRGKWELESTTTSEFALSWLVYSIKWSDQRRGWANGGVDDSVFKIVTDRYPRFALADWQWPIPPTRFHGSADLVVELQGAGDEAWLWVTSRTKQAYREFVELLAPAKVVWEASSDEWPDRWVTSADEPE